MTPKGKVFAFGAVIFVSYGIVVSSVFLFFDKGYPHGRLVASLDIMFVAATTVFASSSKFAKEVGWFFTWRRKTGHTLNEYPEKREDKDRFEPELHSEILRLGRLLIAAKSNLEGSQMKRPRDRQAVCGARTKFEAREIDFNEYWEMLKHLKMKPRNPNTRKLYKNRKEFLWELSADLRSLPMLVRA